MITLDAKGWNLQVAQIARASTTKPKPSPAGKIAQADNRKKLGRTTAARHAWDATIGLRRPPQSALDEWWTIALERFAVLRPERGRRASEWALASQDKQGRILKATVARVAAEDLGLIPPVNPLGEK
jgi:hypothetical protein